MNWETQQIFEEIVLKLEPKIDQFSLRTMLGIIMNAI